MKKLIAKFGAGHYEAIAEIIRNVEPHNKRDMIVNVFVDGFNKRSNLFDAARFKDRCNPVKVPLKTSEGRVSKIASKSITLPKI